MLAGCASPVLPTIAWKYNFTQFCAGPLMPYDSNLHSNIQLSNASNTFERSSITDIMISFLSHVLWIVFTVLRQSQTEKPKQVMPIKNVNVGYLHGLIRINVLHDFEILVAKQAMIGFV